MSKNHLKNANYNDKKNGKRQKTKKTKTSYFRIIYQFIHLMDFEMVYKNVRSLVRRHVNSNQLLRPPRFDSKTPPVGLTSSAVQFAQEGLHRNTGGWENNATFAR